MKRLLILEDHQVEYMDINRFVSQNTFPYETVILESVHDAIHQINQEKFDLILSDYYLQDGTAIDILNLEIEIPVIVVAKAGNEKLAIEAIKNGAYDYLIKDIEGNYLKMLQITIEHCLNRYQNQIQLIDYQAHLEDMVEKRTLELQNELHARKEAEKLLRQSELRYRKLVQMSPDAIVVHQNGRIVFANKAAINLFKGSKTSDMIDRSALDFMHPDDREMAQQRIIEMYRTGKPAEINVERMIKLDGTMFYAEVFAVLIDFDSQKASLVVIHDITHRKENLIRLEESELKFRQLFEKLGDAVFVTGLGPGERGQILEANPAAEYQTGYSRKELLKMNIIDDLVVPGNENISLSAWEERLLNGEIFSNIEQKRRKDGTQYWTEVIVTPFNYNGRLATLSINHDITLRKKTEEELLQALEKAQEADRLKNAFLQNISHEIRTPMNGILGFADLLNNPNLSNSTHQEYLKIIETSGQRLIRTLDQIMEMALVETGIAKLNISSFSIRKEITAIYNFFKIQAEAKKLKFDLSLEKGIEKIMMQSDREKFYGIVSNLVGNAIKYTHQGNILLSCKLNKNYGQDQVIISVKDTGIGIEADRQEAVFERFVQADIEDRAVYEGTGLGLTIVKAYIEMMKGEIWMESLPGVGSEFYIRLPVKCEETMGTKSTKEQTQILIDESFKQMKKLNIMVVDDEPHAPRYLYLVLKSIINKFYEATSGKEAIEILEKNNDIDLILMDMKMPNMNGFEATRIIKEKYPEIIVIAQTAYALQGDKQKTLEAGCDAYLAKPVNRADLMRTISTFFSV